MADEWITIEQLADYMEVDELVRVNANLAIAAACAAVRRELGQYLTSSLGVEVRDGTEKQVLRLRERPVRRVDYVMVDDVQLDSGEWKQRGARIALPNGYFTYGLDNVQVQYLHGYDIKSDDPYPIPADIRLVTLSAARRAYEFRGENTGTEQSETIGKYSYTLSNAPGEDFELIEAEKLALEAYAISVVI